MTVASGGLRILRRGLLRKGLLNLRRLVMGVFLGWKEHFLSVCLYAYSAATGHIVRGSDCVVVDLVFCTVTRIAVGAEEGLERMRSLRKSVVVFPL